MFSLMEVAQETGIAMPILLRYKREHPERIPSDGSGAQQRFPEAAFAVFQEIHDQELENRDLPHRGGFGLLSLPRVKRSREHPDERAGEEAETSETSSAVEGAAGEEASPTGRRAYRRESWSKASSDRAPEGLASESTSDDAAAKPQETGKATLTLKDISEAIDVAYPTVARYATKFPDRIPHVGEGRKRRFPPEAIEVFRQIRKESKPGRPPKSKTKAGDREAVPPKAAPAPEGPETRAATAAAPSSGPRMDGEILRRIELLERNHGQLETMVRALREQLERPMTVTVEPE